MGTFKDANREIDDRAVHIVEGILLGPDWNVARPDKDKVGLDVSVDLLEGRHPQIRSHLQIKGMGPRTRKGKRQALISQDGTLSQAIELEHLDFWMKLPVPVFLVVVDITAQMAYYVHMQRYVLEELKDDDWRDRLSAFTKARARKRSGTKPTKAIKVCSKKILADTTGFREAVRDANGHMASLAVSEGIAYREETFRRLDERLDVKYVRTKDGEHFHIEAKEPVELKLRAKLSKKKFDALFGRGLPTSLDPGELTIEGSPLWERIVSESNSAQIKRERRGVINIIRLDASGTPEPATIRPAAPEN